MLGIVVGSNDNEGPELWIGVGFKLAVGEWLDLDDGVMLVLGSKLGTLAGSIDTDGATLLLIKGDLDGILLSFVVGGMLTLTLGSILGLGVEAGSNESDGYKEGLLNGFVLSVGPSLGLSFGETDTVGGTLPLNDGPMDMGGTGTLVGCIDGGFDFIMDGSVLTIVSLTLGISVGKCETDDGSELTLGR